MTKIGAFEALEAGKKLTHTLFNPEEYIYLDGEEMVMGDDGSRISAEIFWKDREYDFWNTGWSLYAESFQQKVKSWVLVCFGKKIANDIPERNQRFFEEATELVQSTGLSKSECYQLVDYVYNRPVGETNQEVGGVMVTLAALCAALNINMDEAGNTEIERVQTIKEKIRAKQAAKPRYSPLPMETGSVEQNRVQYYEDKIEMLDRINQEKDKEIAELKEQLIRTEKCLSIFQKAEQNKLSVEENEDVQVEVPQFPADRKTLEMEIV